VTLSDDEPSLAGRVIGITADRRWEEQADLFRRRGAEVIHGPTMATVTLTDDPVLRSVTETMIDTPPDWLIVTTGAGFRLWLETAESWGRRDELVESLARASTTIVCRGAKGASAVKGSGLAVAWRAEHESMDEVVAFVESTMPADANVAVQLFDPDDHWSTTRLRDRWPSLVEIRVYRWRLPDDLAPAQALVWAAVARTVHAITFTSQPAVRFLFAIARQMGLEVELRAVLETDVLAVCVGPVCAEALVDNGVERTVWPDPPRLVPMVKLTESHLLFAAPAGFGLDDEW
jgi:uroporphyrinogen-III synthase